MRLTLEGVRKEYGDTVALGGRENAESRLDTGTGTDSDLRTGTGTDSVTDGVSFEVDDGEFFTLVGPSGCGKTTTLRLVAGFDSPTSGTVRFDDRAMRGVPPEDRDVGVVFQNYALFPHLSVAENVAYGLKFADPPDGETREERVTSLLELVDLPDAGDRDPDELSGGQQQRVALARALAPDPDLLLLDEPMSALDARLRERLRMQIKEIQSTLGITTLYVTHDQEEALAISDRVAVMNDGRIEQIGTPQAVYRRPESRFVAEFVGDNNVFGGTVVDVRASNAQSRPRSASEAAESPLEMEGLRGESDDAGVEERETGDAGTQDLEAEASVRESESGRSRAVTVDVEAVDIRIETPVPVSAGDHVVFCVRPEKMRVRDAGDRPTGERAPAEGPDPVSNALEATVSESEFLGDSTRTHLRWKGRELTVRTDDPISGAVRVEFTAADAHLVERSE
ncbi:ABC transporter ATP-binding protein [Halobellus rufus]|uniref:ABC transporter ATP-binding protein n=1 Tax=Halobellus rufus TaxID=1448860 RepID=UPI0009DD2808|nr:ABC transporter ATP-binding protein [Halobellus rufus]